MLLKYRNKLAALLLTLLSGLFLLSCSEKGIDPVDVKTNRTVLVYMIADNSLGRGNFDQYDIDEMKAAALAGGLQNGRLLVYCSPYRSPYATEPVVTQLLEITPAGEAVVLKTYDDNQSSVDVQRMQQVIKDTRALAPASDYGLVLWSHANGWQEGSNSRSRSFGQDGVAGPSMKITSLATALADFYHSFIYFDCCEMATVEVAYELRHVTDVIIASGTELPSEGTCYDKNVPLFLAPTLDPEEIAQTTFNNLRSCTISVIYTAPLDNLAAATREIMMTGALPTVSLDYQQSYMKPATGVGSTIYDMARYIDTLDCSDSLKLQWLDAFEKVVSLALATNNVYCERGNLRISYYCGLGTFILTDPADASYYNYKNQSWWKDVVSFHPLYNPALN